MNRSDIKKAQYIFEGKLKDVAFLTNPFYFVRKNLYEAIKRYAPRMKGSILDFGCGAKPYAVLFENCSEYIGIDIDVSGHDHINENIDVYYDGKHIPFEDERFDNVFSSEVFEHIADPEDIIPEIRRVLKTGGYLLVTVPFVWNEHEVPYDFKRYTSYGIIDLLKKQGFEIIRVKKSTSYLEMIYQMKAEYYRYLFSKKSPIVRHFMQGTIISFQNFKGTVMNRIFPKNATFYGDNIVLCKKL